MVGKDLSKVGEEEWKIPELRELLDEIVHENKPFENFKIDHEFPKIGRKVLLLNARKLERGNSALPLMILLAMEDVTEKSSQ